jgi:hypothetical protein
VARRNGWGLATAGAVNEARKTVGDCERDGQSLKPKTLTSQTNGDPADAIARAIFAHTKPKSTAITAKLTGVDTIVALGVTTVSATPVLTLCAELVAADIDPESPLTVYRGNTLALIVRSIGEGANLEINARGTAFIHKSDRRRGSPAHQNGSDHIKVAKHSTTCPEVSAPTGGKRA